MQMMQPPVPTKPKREPKVPLKNLMWNVIPPTNIKVHAHTIRLL